MAKRSEYGPQPVRSRNQLVVALGDGDVGRARRAAIEVAAENAGKTLSAWGLSVLMKAVGTPIERHPSLAEFEALVERVRELEFRLNGIRGD